MQGSGNLENHVPYISLIDEYKDRRFTEYMILHDPNSYIGDNQDSLFAGGLREPIKKEIIYVVK